MAIYEMKIKNKVMFGALFIVIGFTTVLAYSDNDGSPSRITRSIRHWVPNTNHRRHMVQRMDIGHARSWQPTSLNVNTQMHLMRNRPQWIPRMNRVPFQRRMMHMVGARAPFTWRNVHPTSMPARFPSMFPGNAGHSFPDMILPWQSFTPTWSRMMHLAPFRMQRFPINFGRGNWHPIPPSQNQHWMPLTMQRFPILLRHGFGGQGPTGSGGVQSSTEPSAGKGPRGATPFDDRR